MKRPPSADHHPRFLIDRNLSDEDLINALRGFGFDVVSHYEHYTLETTPDPQTVPDSEIIRECSKLGWTLLTADGKMEYAHFSVIRQSDISMFIVPSNDKNPRRWAEAMVKGRQAIYRCIKNYRLPFIARLNASGTVYQLRCACKTDQTPADCALLIKDGRLTRSVPKNIGSERVKDNEATKPNRHLT